jgi:hypothetical protein
LALATISSYSLLCAETMKYVTSPKFYPKKEHETSCVLIYNTSSQYSTHTQNLHPLPQHSCMHTYEECTRR